ncbi:unnamed protein product [Lactuca saligna]|uniref:Uncharacterized protein n=1 Tax=Lactuca saligna TaxID=75948 RepID=A0AA35YIA3_LACSI|nr:unnamed protein product [Lactuca saligna]
MAAQSGDIPSEADFKLLGDAYGLSSIDGVEFPSPKSMILSPPLGKVGIYLKTLENGLRLLLTKLQDEILQKNGCIIQMLTLNVINKVVAFEMICRATGLLHDYFVFKYFFRFSATGDK